MSESPTFLDACRDTLDATDGFSDRRGDYCADTAPEIVPFNLVGYDCSNVLTTRQCSKVVQGARVNWRVFADPTDQEKNLMGCAFPLFGVLLLE